MIVVAMKKRRGAIPVLAVVGLFAVGQRGPAAETIAAYGFSQRGGTAQFTGFPSNPEFSMSGGYGILRFRVSTKDVTLECYDQGTNIAELRDLQGRLAEVVAWNGQGLLEGKQPQPVVVLGVFDLREWTVLVTGIRIPRVGQGDDGEVVAWDWFDPNRGDAPLPYEGNYPYYEPTFYEPYEPYADAVIVPQVVNNYYYAPPDYGRYRYYPYSYGYSGYYRPWYSHRPSYRPSAHYPSRGESKAPSDSAPAGSAISYPRLAMPRAERWGQARQIALKFTDSTALWSFTKYLNPSQLESAEKSPDRGRPRHQPFDGGGHGRHPSRSGSHSSGRSHGYRGR